MMAITGCDWKSCGRPSVWASVPLQRWCHPTAALSACTRPQTRTHTCRSLHPAAHESVLQLMATERVFRIQKYCTKKRRQEESLLEDEKVGNDQTATKSTGVIDDWSVTEPSFKILFSLRIFSKGVSGLFWSQAGWAAGDKKNAHPSSHFFSQFMPTEQKTRESGAETSVPSCKLAWL